MEILVNVIVIAVIVIAVALAVAYIVRAKKKGQTCIGCPNAASCSGHCSGCAGKEGVNKREDGKQG